MTAPGGMASHPGAVPRSLTWPMTPMYQPRYNQCMSTAPAAKTAAEKAEARRVADWLASEREYADEMTGRDDNYADQMFSANR